MLISYFCVFKLLVWVLLMKTLINVRESARVIKFMQDASEQWTENQILMK